MFNTSNFHEREDVRLLLSTSTDRHRVAAYFESIGFHVERDSDFCYLPRNTEETPWQSSDVTQVDFLLNSQPSLSPSPIDSLNFIFLLATLPASVIPEFLEIVDGCHRTFGGVLYHNDQQVSMPLLTELMWHYVDDIRIELSDEPGTDFTARMIYEFAPRG